MKLLDKIVISTLLVFIFTNIGLMMYNEDGTWLRIVYVGQQLGKEIATYVHKM